MLFKILQRKMNEKIKKVFASIGVFFSLVFLHPCYVCSESVYTMTETELKQLEENNQIIKNQLETLKIEVVSPSEIGRAF